MGKNVSLSFFDYIAVSFFILMFYGLSPKSMYIIVPCFLLVLFSSGNGYKRSLPYYLLFSIIAALGIYFGNCDFLEFTLYFRQTLSIITIILYTAYYRSKADNGKWYLLSTILFYTVVGFTLWSLLLNVLFPATFSLREATEDIEGMGKNLLFTSYAFAHAIPLVLPLLIYSAKSAYGIKRFGLYAIVIAILYYLLHNSITTSFFLSLIAVAMAVMLSENTFRNKTMYIIGLVLLLAFLIGSVTGVLDFLSSISGSDTFSTKVEDIQDYRQTGESSEMGGRIYRFQTSLSVFLSHPIVGSFDGNQLGHHNFLIDYMAFYGILFVLPLFIFFWIQIKDSKSRIHEKLLPYFYISLIPFLGLAFLKGQGVVYNHTMLMMLFFILPGMFEKRSQDLYSQEQ